MIENDYRQQTTRDSNALPKYVLFEFRIQK
jgi:hypothetical protein